MVGLDSTDGRFYLCDAHSTACWGMGFAYGGGFTRAPLAAGSGGSSSRPRLSRVILSQPRTTSWSDPVCDDVGATTRFLRGAAAVLARATEILRCARASLRSG